MDEISYTETAVESCRMLSMTVPAAFPTASGNFSGISTRNNSIN
jgi:hypothetical protein